MRKVSVAHGVSIKPIALYRSDILGLFRVLRDLGFNPVVQTDSCEYDSLEELEDRPMEAISMLKVSLKDPYVVVEVSSGRAWLSRVDESVQALGVYTKLEEFLKLRVSPRRAFSFGFALYFITTTCFLVFYVVGYLLIGLLAHADASVGKLGGLVLGSVVSLSALKLLASPQPDTTLSLAEKPVRESFWRRNHDRILSGVIVAIFTFILTLLVQHLQCSSRKHSAALPRAVPADSGLAKDTSRNR